VSLYFGDLHVCRRAQLFEERVGAVSEFVATMRNMPIDSSCDSCSVLSLRFEAEVFFTPSKSSNSSVIKVERKSQDSMPTLLKLMKMGSSISIV
jgi:hypothetical protein